jgi:outer membrane protein
MKKKYFLFIVFLIFSEKIFSQNAMTLQQCIAFALEHNLQLKQTKLSEKNAELNYQQAKANFLPSFSADATQYFSFGKSLNFTTNNYEETNSTLFNVFTVNSALTIFSGLSKFNQYLQMNAEKNASHFDVLKNENDLAISVIGTFLNLLNATEQLKIFQNQLALSQQLKNQTQKLISGGMLAESASYDMDASLANDKLNVVNAQNNMEIAKLGLKKILNWSMNDDLQIDTSSVKTNSKNNLPTDLNFQNTYSASLQFYPQIQSSEFRIKSAQKNFNYYQGMLMPTLSLLGGLRTSYSNINLGDYSTQIKNNFGQAFGFDLSVPLLNGFLNRTFYNKSKLQLLNAKINLDNAKVQLQQDIENAIINVKGALSKQEAATENLIAMKKSYEVNQKKYESGLINYYELLLVKNNLAKAENDETNARYDLQFKIKVLEYFQGKPLY